MEGAKNDIASRKDLEHLLRAFYSRAMSDERIGHFFTTVVPLDLEAHLPHITDFWASVLFNTQGYRKNVMEVHANIHRLSAIGKEHLDHWVALLTDTIDERHEGQKAELMKQRARSIATLMDIKLNHQPINKIS